MTDHEFSEDFSKLLNNIATMKSLASEFNQNIKSLEKAVKKKLRQVDKMVAKNKNKNNKKATGFAKPAYISNELCKFMNIPDGTSMARTDVTKYIIQYIKDKKLPDEEDKRKIKPDKKLKTLLNIKPTDEVTYFNLQQYMNKHFVSPTIMS